MQRLQAVAALVAGGIVFGGYIDHLIHELKIEKNLVTNLIYSHGEAAKVQIDHDKRIAVLEDRPR